MNNIESRVVIAAIQLSGLDKRPFTPVVAVLMEDAGNKALRALNFKTKCRVCWPTDAAGNVGIRFRTPT